MLFDLDVVTSTSKNLGVRAEIFGRIYAQTPAVENPAHPMTKSPPYDSLRWYNTAMQQNK